MDEEQFELCREVYKRFPEWKTGRHIWSMKRPVICKGDDFMDGMSFSLYTSDYLLEKLPEWIGKYGDMQMSRGYMKGGTGAFRFFYGRYGQEASIEGTGVTAVSALLKLAIALDDAGVKL